MRILTGKYKGRIIRMPKGIRPTQDKVRKALFDILGDMEGLSFLELFAGSGAVGIEALSQGSKEAVFVEKDRQCLKTLEHNLSLLGYSGYRVIGLDVFKAIEALVKDKKKFDIIFSDPPYYQGLVKKTLQILGAYDILAPNGFIVLQHFKRDQLPKEQGELRLIKEARYGDTVLSFYKSAAVGTVPVRRWGRFSSKTKVIIREPSPNVENRPQTYRGLSLPSELRCDCEMSQKRHVPDSHISR